MIPRAVQLDNLVKESIAGSITYTEYHDPRYQGPYVEVTTFVGRGKDKQRLDFAFPTELYDHYSNEELRDQIVLANDLRRGAVERVL